MFRWTLLFTSLALLTEATCPSGYLADAYRGDGVHDIDTTYCLKVFPGQMNRVAAQQACQQDGSSLPWPTTTNQAKFFASLDIGNLWLQQTCQNVGGVSSCAIVNSTGNDTTYNGGSASVTDSCLYADSDGLFHNANCFSIQATALCVQDIKLGASYGSSGLCFEGYFQLGDYCYKAYTQPKVAQKSAEDTCRYDGGHLVAIGSSEENNFVYSLATYYIGNGSARIGLNKEYDKKYYTWTSWAHQLYTNFYNIQDAQGGSVDNCVAINQQHPYDGKWVTVTCNANSSSIGGFVCKRPAATLYNTY